MFLFRWFKNQQPGNKLLKFRTYECRSVSIMQHHQVEYFRSSVFSCQSPDPQGDATQFNACGIFHEDSLPHFVDSPLPDFLAAFGLCTI